MRTKKIRFLFMVLMGIAVSLILDNLKIGDPPTDHNKGMDFIISIVITIIVWEGNLRIDSWMNEHFPWENKPSKRIFVHLPLSMVFSALVIYLSMLAFNKYVCEFPAHTKDKFMMASIVIGMLITVIILSIEISSQFFINWKHSLVEMEKYKAESLQAQLQNLKDQVNPHFMFNNLSVLSSLVYKDQDKAVDFINQLSKVYRYLLDSRGTELVSLGEELAFIQSYTYLLQIRFDKNLRFDINIPEEKESLLLPPMALQMLVENAIKHNEISNELPLHVEINVKEDTLEISNNLQLRSNPEVGSKTGLKNIKERYKFFTTEEVKVNEIKGKFIVAIPLLKAR
jgi:two-component system, LytTR family, sensor kinase